MPTSWLSGSASLSRTCLRQDIIRQLRRFNRILGRCRFFFRQHLIRRPLRHLHSDRLLLAVARTIVGKDAQVKVLRDGKEQTIAVKVAERPTDEVLAKKEPASSKEPVETAKLPDNVLASIRVQGLDAATMSQLNIPAKMTGVVVTSVEGGGPGEAAGLQRGDVIQEVNHEVVKTLEDYQTASNKLKKDELAVLLLSRQGNSLFVAVNPK